jgi:acetyl esterase/lipase
MMLVMPNRIPLLLIPALSLFLSTAVARAETPTTLPVFPTTAPGEPSGIGPEHLQPVTPRNPVERVTDVTVPSIALYPAATDKNTGAAVVICPGGAYKILAMDLEGTEIASWLNSIGVNAIVLKYRVPDRSNLPPYLPPLQDAQRAMSLVRKNAAEWKIDPKRIGILGFSAGGNLAARLSTNYDQRAYPPIDDVDAISCRPDFTVLIYPAWLNDKKGDLIPDLKVTAQTPPMFIVQTTDDPINPESSVAMYLALKHAKVSVEMHLYAQGGHGYGLRPSDHPVATWPARCADWMKAMNLLKPE